jgi:hypothetical protein
VPALRLAPCALRAGRPALVLVPWSAEPAYSGARKGTGAYAPAWSFPWITFGAYAPASAHRLIAATTSIIVAHPPNSATLPFNIASTALAPSSTPAQANAKRKNIRFAIVFPLVNHALVHGMPAP